MYDQWIFFCKYLFSTHFSSRPNEVEEEKKNVLNQPIRCMNFIKFFSLIFGSSKRSKNVHVKWRLNFVFTSPIAHFRQWSRNLVIYIRCKKKNVVGPIGLMNSERVNKVYREKLLLIPKSDLLIRSSVNFAACACPSYAFCLPNLVWCALNICVNI